MKHRCRELGRVSIFIILALSLAGFLVLSFATKRGIGIIGDASVYIGVGRSLLNGQGLMVPFGKVEPYPLTHFPPFFPMLLAAVGFFGMDPQTAAKWVQSFLFGTNIFLIGFMIRRSAVGSLWAPIAGSFIILSTESMLKIHMTAVSEPLFVSLGFLGLFLLGEYFDNRKKSFLVASSVAIGLAVLTRYIGVALIATGFAGLILLNKGKYTKRILDSILFSAISSYPIALWAHRNYQIVGRATDREMIFHPFDLVRIEVGLNTISMFILPPNFSSVAAGIILLSGVLGLLVFNLARLGKRGRKNDIDKPERNSKNISLLLCIFLFFYLAVLIVSMSFFDVLTWPTERILLPVFVSLVILASCQLHALLTHSRRKQLLKIACISFFAALSASNMNRGVPLIQDAYSNGYSFANDKDWQQSEIMKVVQAAPSGIVIYSNREDVIYVLTGKPCSLLPFKRNPFTLQINHDYVNLLLEMRGQLATRDGLLVYFTRPVWPRLIGSEEELVEFLQLELEIKTHKGSIYRVRR